MDHLVWKYMLHFSTSYKGIILPSWLLIISRPWFIQKVLAFISDLWPNQVFISDCRTVILLGEEVSCAVGGATTGARHQVFQTSVPFPWPQNGGSLPFLPHYMETGSPSAVCVHLLLSVHASCSFTALSFSCVFLPFFFFFDVQTVSKWEVSGQLQCLFYPFQWESS